MNQVEMMELMDLFESETWMLSNMARMYEWPAYSQLNSPEALKEAFRRIAKGVDDETSNRWHWTWFVWMKLPSSNLAAHGDPITDKIFGYSVSESCKATAEWGRENGWIDG